MKRLLWIAMVMSLPLGLMAEDDDHVKVGDRKEEGFVLNADKQEKDKKELTKRSAFQGKSLSWDHPWTHHFAILLSSSGDRITLEDESVWVVHAGDTYKTSNWLVTDVLTISLGSNGSPYYPFVIKNLNTGVSIRVNIYLGPSYDSPYRHVIIAIDDYKKVVYLEDGSAWSLLDDEVLGTPRKPKWLVGDTVIIGTNRDWISYFYPNLLINVNTLTWSRS